MTYTINSKRQFGTAPIIVELDDEDVQSVLCYTWKLGGENKDIIHHNGLTLGRFILNYLGPLEIDHKNRNIFDNKKINLRLATKSQQMANRGPMDGKEYKGTSWHKRDKKFQASIEIEGKCEFLGYFDLEKYAAQAYDAKAFQVYGEFAYLNFPEKFTLGVNR